MHERPIGMFRQLYLRACSSTRHFVSTSFLATYICLDIRQDFGPNVNLKVYGWSDVMKIGELKIIISV